MPELSLKRKQGGVAAGGEDASIQNERTTGERSGRERKEHELSSLGEPGVQGHGPW